MLEICCANVFPEIFIHSACLEKLGSVEQGQTSGGSYLSDRTPPDAIMKRVDGPSAWSSPSDLDRRVAPHAHIGVVGAPNY